MRVDLKGATEQLKDLLVAVALLDEVLVWMESEDLCDADIYKRIDAFLYYQPGEGEREEVE
ncbi:hypothetical protein X831_gp068 [Pseudomonas phage PAK_P2]|uniref:Uncharacterized protein n=1 Tax=Pseudomonas phage PAK_P2 TaxID=1348912 RepID=V5JVH4_9CAUD|nr:hypothetical protein X831_gp068 [Pseudomonas phage PAK_P2]AGR89188.1 hypothetical protein PAK_P200067 [Pseudomonas phage PAK_P2]